MPKRDLLSQRFLLDDLLRRFRAKSTPQQFAGWVNRGVFRSTPASNEPAAKRTFSVRDGLSAALMAQHVNVICPSTATAAMLANSAAGEIMNSPVFRILADPDNAPDEEYLLLIARADIWVVRVVPRDALDFSDAYATLVINVSDLLRDIAPNLKIEFD